MLALFAVDIKSNCQKWLYTVPLMVEVLRQDLSFLFFFFCLCLGFILLLSGVERLPRLMVEMASCLLKRLSGNQLVTMNKRISVCSVGYDYLSIGVHFTSVLSNINLDLSFDFFCLSFVRKPSVGWPSVCDWLWVTKILHLCISTKFLRWNRYFSMSSNSQEDEYGRIWYSHWFR